MKVKKLEYIYKPSAGSHIYAHLKSGPINCVEFSMKGDKPQRILQVDSEQIGGAIMIGFDMWIQFPPKEWKEMVEKTFKEMVEAWNEKYGLKEI